MIVPAAMAQDVAQNADDSKGQALHQTSCVRCHDHSVYTRSDRKMKSADQLRIRVAFCGQQVNAQWFDDEVDAVTLWLNRSFYKFNK
ncbi:MAG: cytochrome c [Magnetococcales bacterium]|nr:cytochrome c [Magnetococcales bacterium]